MQSVVNTEPARLLNPIKLACHVKGWLPQLTTT